MKAVLDHVGIAVTDLEASLAFFRDALGLDVEPPEDVPSQRVRAQFISTGPVLARAAAGDRARFADRKISRASAVPGSITSRCRVDDIRAALAQLRERERAAHRRGAQARCRGCDAWRSSIPRARRACSSSSSRRRVEAARAPELPKTIRLGDIDIVTVSDGFFYLDGGAMFGVVPKTFWEKKAPPDERNRIRMAMRCLLVRGARTMLIDAGCGRQDDAEAGARSTASSATSTSSTRLPAAGVSPDAIDIVLATHLHFDHAGGFTARGADGTVRPAISARAVHRPARRVGRRDEPERAHQGQLLSRELQAAGRSPRAAAGR